jgi:hypothetical protein
MFIYLNKKSNLKVLKYTVRKALLFLLGITATLISYLYFNFKAGKNGVGKMRLSLWRGSTPPFFNYIRGDFFWLG